MPTTIDSLNEVIREIAEECTTYWQEPFPHKLDSAITKLVNVYLSAPDDERILFFDKVGTQFPGYLLAFAERMASIGVHEKSGKKLLEGLIALIIEDGRGGDLRDTIIRMAPLYDAAGKIGIDSDNLFRTAASYSNNEVAELISAFPERLPGQKSLRAMGYREVNSPDGFIYERIPWTEM